MRKKIKKRKKIQRMKTEIKRRKYKIEGRKNIKVQLNN